MKIRSLTALAIVVCLLLSGGYAATPSAQTAGSMPVSEPIRIQSPGWLPPAHMSPENLPTLRNISTTVPYMAHVSLLHLKEVAELYVGGAHSNDRRLPLIKSLDFLAGQEREDLVAFPESLAGGIPPGVGAPV